MGGYVSPSGKEIQLDLPKRFHIRNRGGSDGAGLCVFASMSHAGIWANNAVFSDMFRYMRKYPGGGWPSKVDRVVNEYCSRKGLSKPRYLQVEGDDLELLRRACARGYMPSITYYGSPTGRYGRRRIHHMVSLLHAEKAEWGILDNNYPGSIEWLDDNEFRRAYTGGGRGWAVILLEEGPPPVPRNRPSTEEPTLTNGARMSDPRYQWTSSARKWGKCLFYQGGQIGFYDYLEDKYYPWNGHRFGSPCACPVPPPGRVNYGAFTKKIRERHYSLGGVEVTRERAAEALEELPDTSDKMRAVIIGSQAERDRTRRLLSGLEGWRDRLVVHSYPPRHWHVAGLGFERGLSILTPEGIELHRQTDFGGDLCRALESSHKEWDLLRRRNPNFRPSRTPDRRRLFPSLTTSLPWSAYVVGGVLLLVLFLRRE